MKSEVHSPYIDVFRPKSKSPIVISIPHSSVFMPPRFKKDLRIPPDKIWTDWYTAELYSFLPQLGFYVIKNQISRYVADPSRSLANPEFGPVVHLTTYNNAAIYQREPGALEIDQRIAIAYTPYHQTLVNIVREAQERYQSVLFLDLHSFNRTNFIVDGIIGDGQGRSAREECVVLFESALKSQNLTTVRNEPWSGGWTVRRFDNDNSVDAIQLELNQRSYLNVKDLEKRTAPPKIDEEKFARTQKMLKEAFEQVRDSYRNR